MISADTHTKGCNSNTSPININRNKGNLQSIYLLSSEKCQRIYPSNSFHSWHPLVFVWIINTTLQSILPNSLGQLLGQWYGLVIIESIDAKKKKIKQAKTHTHKQNSIKKQIGCCVTQITLNCCETVFQNSSSIKKTAILFFQKFDTETTLTHIVASIFVLGFWKVCVKTSIKM